MLTSFYVGYHKGVGNFSFKKEQVESYNPDCGPYMDKSNIFGLRALSDRCVKSYALEAFISLAVCLAVYFSMINGDFSEGPDWAQGLVISTGVNTGIAFLGAIYIKEELKKLEEINRIEMFNMR